MYSPCTGVCSLDNSPSRVCRGCLRSIDEIMRWAEMGDEERWGIIERIFEMGFDGHGVDRQPGPQVLSSPAITPSAP